MSWKDRMKTDEEPGSRRVTTKVCEENISEII